MIVKELETQDLNLVWDQLPVADYIIGDYAIERKTLPDLTMSLKDGRLRRQKQAIKAYANPIFLITGETWHGYNKQELAAITSIIRSGISCLHVESEVEAAKILARIATYTLTQKAAPVVPIAIGAWPSDERDQLVFAISVLPGISKVRAAALLKHFGSIHGIMTADAAELAETPGIGAKTAARLHALFHRQF